MEIDGEYFGSDGQRQVQRRAASVWRLVRDDPRFYTHGRAVGLSSHDMDNVADQVALTRLMGASSCDGVPKSEFTARKAALEAAGLGTDAFVSWRGGSGAFAAAEAVLASRSLPDDLTVVDIGPDTPSETLARLDTLTQSCEVLLPMGAFMRGIARPAVCIVAEDADGRAVGCSSAVAQFHPDHPRGNTSWWGMLATDDARRGQGIALILGAMSMLAMRDRHGMEAVSTGIREGNTSSEVLCAKLGLAPTDEIVMISVDPQVLAGGRITK
ncbi:hypothetical protein HKCCE3408_01750 [Rhodobacterales bacterium HKCCE3408]|nr:hypothetical protein [Rhodobacterales bacterium HKCCE3408]